MHVRLHVRPVPHVLRSTLALSTAALVLLAAPAVAAAPQPPPADTLVLAVEAGEPQGPAPRGADNSENEFAPENYEPNFLWGAAVGLLAIVLLAGLALGGLYYVLVVRREPAGS